jgi:hypothetical protein
VESLSICIESHIEQRIGALAIKPPDNPSLSAARLQPDVLALLRQLPQTPDIGCLPFCLGILSPIPSLTAITVLRTSPIHTSSAVLELGWRQIPELTSTANVD